MDFPKVCIKAILLMGGEGKRFGSTIPKQFHRLSGKKIYLHTLDKLLLCSEFEKIILVCHPDWIPVVKEEIKEFTKVSVVESGTTRQESTYLGLLACGQETRYVVIHDAVRPFVTKEILAANIEGVIKNGAVDTCIPLADTIVHAVDSSKIETIPIRDHYQRGQTPQSFDYKIILEAHTKAIAVGIRNASDDCQLVLTLSHSVAIVKGSEENIKITTEVDLFIAEQLLRLQVPHIPTSSNKLIGKKYVVTGGTGGIGQAICEKLKNEGAEIIPLARHSTPYSGDLRHEPVAKQLFIQIGPIDGLINSIGSLTMKSLAALSHDDIQEQIETNLTALIFCCKWAQIKNGGHILNIASSSYSRGRKDYSIYSATKAAVVNFTQALSEERKDLFVNVLVPQRTNTPLRKQNFPDEDPQSLLSPVEVAEEAIKILKTDLTGLIAIHPSK